MDLAQHARILDRLTVLAYAPVWDTMADEPKRAFLERLTADPVTWGDVAEADKQLIRRGEFEVSAGKSRHLVDPSTWGDHQRIDAAVDSGNVDELDDALYTVGKPREQWSHWATGLPLDDGDTEVLPEDFADSDWVGL